MPVPTSVTVVMPTHRRPASLRRALESLGAQAGPGLAWDVVVVDNDPSAGALSMVGQMADSFPVPLRAVHEEHLGAAHARNRGLAEATGDIVAFVDDDVTADRHWLATLVEPIVAGRCGGTAGRVVLDPVVARPRWFDEEGIGGYLARFEPAIAETPLGPDSYALTANAAFSTGALRATGGFDPALGPRGRTQLAGEDNRIVRDFLAQGATMHFVPWAVVVHELPPSRLTRRYLLRRAYLQGRSDWMLDRGRYIEGRFHGMSGAFSWLATELRRRRSEGWRRPEVRFHAATDMVRTAGAVRQAVSWWWPGAS
ncbi:MAG TPA: glycosyltransferase family 2 protein [Acidimicrobiales bacterium]|nr:glycosyltransferase family 2 protein [Acidimicrobiales bacterium]